jgi:hypothetical protein
MGLPKSTPSELDSNLFTKDLGHLSAAAPGFEADAFLCSAWEGCGDSIIEANLPGFFIGNDLDALKRWLPYPVSVSLRCEASRQHGRAASDRLEHWNAKFNQR